MGVADCVWPYFGETEITNLALAYELSHGADRLLYRYLRVHSVLIV
jgi:hypothetical protein